MIEKLYCTRCRKINPIRIVPGIVTVIEGCDGRAYEYDELSCFCDICGRELHNSDISNFNARSREKAYKDRKEKK